MAMSSSDISPAATEVFARLDYPMLIVTCPAARAAHQSGGHASGCLVGFSTQCSIDPVRYLVCISKKNHTHEHALAADVLGVHLLDEADRGLAQVFGELTGDVVDKLSLVAWCEGPGGVPILDDAAAWFAGRVLDRVDLGDHTGFVIEPLDGRVRRWIRQLGFQQVRGLDPGHPA